MVAFKQEIFGCFKHIRIPLDELMRMPTKDRKFFIIQHNMAVEKENEEYANAGKNNSNGDMRAFTDMAQRDAGQSK